MDGQWPQQSSDVHTALNLTIQSPANLNEMFEDLDMNDMDGMLGLGSISDTENTGGDASAAAAEQDSDDRQGTSRWHRKRHNKEQILELERVYHQTPHPDENLRRNLAGQLGITQLQVKFWFQNRRAARKTHAQRLELEQLREEKEALQAERLALRAAAQNSSCLSCKGPIARAMLSENASLKDKLQHATAYLNRVSGGRATELIASAHGMPSGSGSGSSSISGSGKGKAVATDHAPSYPAAPMMPTIGGSLHDTNKTMLVGLATRATHELMTLAYTGAPMWAPAPHGEVDMLNFKNYTDTMLPSFFGPYRMGVVVDGTRKVGDVRCTADSLISVLMDAAGWSGMFPEIVVSATATHVHAPIGSRHGMTILMDAQLRVLSPRVPIRRVKFVRQCWNLERAPGTWAVVDASVDAYLGQDTATCRLLPSGCLIQQRSNGCCKVTWIVNMEHDENSVSQMYHPLLCSGHALGACRWLAYLQRQCEYLPIMHSAHMPSWKTNLFEVARRMTRSFCETMCGPWSQTMGSISRWTGSCGIGAERFEVVARAVTYSASGAGVLSVTAPVWLPGIQGQKVFDYLCDVSRRGEWDIVATGAPIHQEGNFDTAQLPGNSVSVLRAIANGKLILQEACADTTCMVLAYATMDEQCLQQAMNNGSAASLSLLPSGLVILPDGASPISAASTSSSTAVSDTSNTGSLVSFMYQTLLNGQTPSEAIDGVGSLLCHIIRKVKEAVHASSVVDA